jgi:hypothetical protein
MFLELPAELRIQIYKVIIDRTIVAKNSVTNVSEDTASKEDERIYRGFLFSSKRILEEYRVEATNLIPPIDSIIQELWTFSEPLLIAPSNEYSLPTHINITLPISLFGPGPLSRRNIMSNIIAIMPTILMHRTRITFSISKSASANSKVVRHAYLPRLYNILCELSSSGWGSLEFSSSLSYYRCPLSKAEAMWLEKGYGKRMNHALPYNSSDYLALYMKRETVVFDAHRAKPN